MFVHFILFFYVLFFEVGMFVVLLFCLRVGESYIDTFVGKGLKSDSGEGLGISDDKIEVVFDK
jgi:hypothetical protein